jgi:hypothetical protein
MNEMNRSVSDIQQDPDQSDGSEPDKPGFWSADCHYRMKIRDRFRIDTTIYIEIEMTL